MRAGARASSPITLRRAVPAALLLGALLALLGGCGFHLQGVTRLPPVLARTYVDAEDRYTDFHQAFGDALRTSGAKLARDADAASSVVEILKDESGQRVLSVSARNTPREYEVYYTIEYRVRTGSRELLAPAKLTLTRDYSFDETALLAKSEEQELIRASLAQELAALVMRRLAALPP